jgi:integrase
VDIRLPQTTKTVVRFLAPEQIVALADAMPARYSLLVFLGAAAGLRQGEAFGLACDRIDSASGMITIDQQVIIVDRHPVLADPKTSSSLRDVPMPAFLLTAVTGHCGQFGLAGNDVLCRTGRGTLLRRD